MSQSISERTRIEREVAIDYVLERLDDLKGSLSDLLDSLDPPHQPPREWDSPDGGESALEAVALAIFRAEEVWRR